MSETKNCHRCGDPVVLKNESKSNNFKYCPECLVICRNERRVARRKLRSADCYDASDYGMLMLPSSSGTLPIFA